MPLRIVQKDISKIRCDAVVNITRSKDKSAEIECIKVFQDENLYVRSKYIIRVSVPRGSLGNRNSFESFCRDSLKTAVENKFNSVAFPLIYFGGVPRNKALRTATAVIGDFLLSYDMLVYIAVSDKDKFRLNRKLFNGISEYINGNYTKETARKQIKSSVLSEEDFTELCLLSFDPSLDDIVNELDESFSQMLLRKIDEKGLTDAEVYKKANIDRRLFSKIRSDINYRTSKSTAIAFAVALELNLDETKEFLMKAGFALSHSNKFDVIIEYFIKKSKYNIFEINEALFAFDQPLLGA